MVAYIYHTCTTYYSITTGSVVRFLRPSPPPPPPTSYIATNDLGIFFSSRFCSIDLVTHPVCVKLLRGNYHTNTIKWHIGTRHNNNMIYII